MFERTLSKSRTLEWEILSSQHLHRLQSFIGDFIYRLATVTCVTSSGGGNRSVETSLIQPKLRGKQVKKMSELRKFEPSKDSLRAILQQLQRLEVMLIQCSQLRLSIFFAESWGRGHVPETESGNQSWSHWWGRVLSSWRCRRIHICWHKMEEEEWQQVWLCLVWGC